ncbi:TPA: hypothetical protein PFE16_004099 [Kluyvera georgiana]|nr:hypothetical protein [Kluyvera georgiana]
MKPTYEELEAKCQLQQDKLDAINKLMGVIESASDLAKDGIANLEQQLSESRREFTAANATIHNLELKVAQVVAENAHARERHIFIRALAVSILEHSGGRMDWRGAMEDATELLQTVDSVYAKTPATDAYLAELRAQGVDAAIEKLLQKFEGTGHIGVPVMVLEHFAAQLRQGADHD